MELTQNYDTSDPFINEKLFYVSDDIDTLELDISFQMKGESGILEIVDNETGEVFWDKTWNEDVDKTTFTISLDSLYKEKEYVVRFTGIKINHVSIIITSESSLVKERERPLKQKNSDTSHNDAPTVIQEDESVQIIRSMMNLDYGSMTVSEFNRTIEALCVDDNTNVFDVISDAYDSLAVYDDSGEFVATVFPDSELELFMQTTLEYSAQEIFGEPVHLGSAIYMITPDLTAKELYQKKKHMSFEEWNLYFEENIEDISIFPVLSYSIETDIANLETLLISERDDRLNKIQTLIREFMFGMDTEEIMVENLWDIIEAEFEAISAANSDAEIKVECRIQGLERDIQE